MWPAADNRLTHPECTLIEQPNLLLTGLSLSCARFKYILKTTLKIFGNVQATIKRPYNVVHQ